MLAPRPASRLVFLRGLIQIFRPVSPPLSHWSPPGSKKAIGTQISCRFHTRRRKKSSGRTNRLRQTDKSSENGTNKFSDDFVVWIFFVCFFSLFEDDFLNTTCPSRQTSRPKSDLNSHSDGLGRTNGRFARLGGNGSSKRSHAGFYISYIEQHKQSLPS